MSTVEPAACNERLCVRLRVRETGGKNTSGTKRMENSELELTQLHVFLLFFFVCVFLYFTLFQMNTYKPRELGASRSNRDHTVRHHRVIYREVSSRSMCLCIKYTSTVRSSRRSVGVILERILQIIIMPRSSERVRAGATSTG